MVSSYPYTLDLSTRIKGDEAPEPAAEPEPATEPEPDGGFIVLDPDVYLADHHDPTDPRDCPILFLPLPVLNEEDASQPPDCVLKLPCGHYLSYLPACQWYLGHTASCPVCRAVLPRPDNVVSTNAQRAHTEYMFSRGDATRNMPVQILDPTQVANTADQEAQQEVDAFLASCHGIWPNFPICVRVLGGLTTFKSLAKTRDNWDTGTFLGHISYIGLLEFNLEATGCKRRLTGQQ